jgi:Glycosyl-hydrolase 97 C-terminal, oligomerisation
VSLHYSCAALVRVSRRLALIATVGLAAIAPARAVAPATSPSDAVVIIPSLSVGDIVVGELDGADGVNGEDSATSVAVDLGFLGEGGWQLTAIGDGAGERSFVADTRLVSAGDRLDVPMRPRGGFALRLTRVP